MLPKLILTDIDGVWTDGGMYYDERGNEFKKFHTYDSAGVLFCHDLNIKVGIITGENTVAVANRAIKLKVDYLFQGADNKLNIICELLDKTDLQWSEIAYIGDDIKDIGLLKKAGISGAPSNAPDYVKSCVHYVTQKKGGEGAFREFVEHILMKNISFEEFISKY